MLPFTATWAASIVMFTVPELCSGTGTVRRLRLCDVLLPGNCGCRGDQADVMHTTFSDDELEKSKSKSENSESTEKYFCQRNHVN